MESILCPVCMEIPTIPVQLKCFPCAREPGRNCSSFTMLCRHCAHGFLELNKPICKRNPLLKCMTCDQRAETVGSSSNNAYDTLYILMKMDTRTLDCPHCDFTGSHLDLCAHLDLDCVHRNKECICGAYIPLSQMENHYITCPQYSKCFECEGYFPRDYINEHLETQHLGKKCRYCLKWIVHLSSEEEANEQFKNHLKFCDHQIYCWECDANIYPQHFHTHFEPHRVEYQQMMVRYKNLLEDVKNTNLADKNRQKRWIQKTIQGVQGSIDYIQNEILLEKTWE